MQELELKYGCNPNQKPVAHLHEGRQRSAHRGAQRQARLHQLPRRLQLLAAGQGAEGGNRASGRGLVQAREPRGRRRGPAAVRGRPADLLRGRARRALGRSPAPTSAPAEPTACAPTATGPPCPTCATPTPPATSRARCPTASSPRATPMRRSRSSRPRRRASTTSCAIDPDYVPAPVECKDVFGVTFEQGHNDFRIDESLLANVVTANKEIPEAAPPRHDRVAHHAQVHAVRTRCATSRTARPSAWARASRAASTARAWRGNKADNWYLRQHPKVLGLQFVEGIRRADRDNAIDVFISDEYEDVLREGAWQADVQGEARAADQPRRRRRGSPRMTGVTVGSRRVLPLRRQRGARAQVGRLHTSWSPAGRSATTT